MDIERSTYESIHQARLLCLRRNLKSLKSSKRPKHLRAPFQRINQLPTSAEVNFSVNIWSSFNGASSLFARAPSTTLWLPSKKKGKPSKRNNKIRLFMCLHAPRWTPYRNLANLQSGAWAFAINYQPRRWRFSRAIYKLFGLFYSRRKLFTLWRMSKRRWSLRIYRFPCEIFHHPHKREENDYRWLCWVVVATGFPLALISHSERLAMLRKTFYGFATAAICFTFLFIHCALTLTRWHHSLSSHKWNFSFVSLLTRFKGFSLIHSSRGTLNIL